MITRVAIALAWLVIGHPAGALDVTHVYHEPRSFDPARGETVSIHFRISEPARVRVHLHDGRDMRIRTLGAGELEGGEHVVTWDGADALGRQVPPEAYPYTIEAAGKSGPPVVWDLTDLTGGEVLEPDPIDWDPEAGHVRYRLEQAARVRIRIGLENNGPLLRTLLDWVPRSKGPHQETWDGLDAAGVLDLARHPKLALGVQAFALPRNAILVSPPPEAIRLVEGLPEPVDHRAADADSRHRMFDYPHQRIETRRDFPLQIELPAALERTADGLPVVRGPTPIRIRASAEDARRILNERCEAVFFVDGQFAFENEVGFLPITWTWDPKGANPGVHYVTANLRGYDGHFGMYTVKVWVEDGRADASAARERASAASSTAEKEAR